MQGQSAGNVRVVIQWDPARTYDYTFIADDEQIRGKCSEKMLNGHPVETQVHTYMARLSDGTFKTDWFAWCLIGDEGR